jgi:hypothetical protein
MLQGAEAGFELCIGEFARLHFVGIRGLGAGPRCRPDDLGRARQVDVGSEQACQIDCAYPIAGGPKLLHPHEQDGKRSEFFGVRHEPQQKKKRRSARRAYAAIMPSYIPFSGATVVSQFE